MVCPSDNSIWNKTAPWTSYVVNTGRFDKIVLVPIPYMVAVADQPLPLCTQPPHYGENFATGIFLDRVLINGKQTTADIKDGPSRTLMLSENLDAEYYNDGPGSDTNLVVLNTSGPREFWMSHWSEQLNADPRPAHNCTERGTGFVWWDTTPEITDKNPPPIPTNDLTASGRFSVAKARVIVINGRAGDFDPGRSG